MKLRRNFERRHEASIYEGSPVGNSKRFPNKNYFSDVFGQSDVHCKERKRWLLQLIFLKGNNVSIATLGEAMELVVADKDDSEGGGESKVITSFGILRLSRFWCDKK